MMNPTAPTKTPSNSTVYDFDGLATAFEAGESAPVPVLVQPIAPPAPPQTHFSESPLQLRIELERTALKAIQAQLARIDTLSAKLDALDSPTDRHQDAVARVWNGVFTSDSAGQLLIRFLDIRGHHQLTYLMESGQFDPSTNGGFIQRFQRKLSDSCTRVFMVHESMPTLESLYVHPDNVAAVTHEYDTRQAALNAQLAQARTDLSDYKSGVKAQLKELDKRFKSLLD